MMQGWIKIYRDIIDNPIWRDSTPEQCKILVTLLSMASWKESDWDWLGEKKKLQPGQFVTSLKRIVNFAGRGVSEKNVRTALDRFQSFGFLTCVSTNKGRLITIVNWGKYQDIDWETGKQTGKQTAGNWQANGKQTAVNWQANNKEGKKVRKEEGKKDQRDIEKGTAFVPLVVGEENEKESEERKEEEEKFPYDLLREEEVKKEGREKAIEVSLRTKEKVVGKEGEKTSCPTVRRIFKDYANQDMDLFEALIGWKEAREKIKKPFTERAARMAIHKLEDLSGGENKKKIAIINQSTFKCWTDIYPLRKDFSAKGKYDNSKNKWEGVTGL